MLHDHYEHLESGYDRDCDKQYGFFLPVVDELVEEFFKRGHLDESFAKVSCPILSGGINFCKLLVRRQLKMKIQLNHINHFKEFAISLAELFVIV